MERLANQLTQSYDWYVAISRGGLMPALLLAQITGQKQIDTFCISSYQEQERQVFTMAGRSYFHLNDKSILVIDDLADTGNTFKAVLHVLDNCYHPKLIHTMAPIVKAKSEFRPTYYLEERPAEDWVKFEYEEQQSLKYFMEQSL